MEKLLEDERKKIETLETEANKLFETEENLIKANEEIATLRNILEQSKGKESSLEAETLKTNGL